MWTNLCTVYKKFGLVFSFPLAHSWNCNVTWTNAIAAKCGGFSKGLNSCHSSESDEAENMLVICDLNRAGNTCLEDSWFMTYFLYSMSQYHLLFISEIEQNTQNNLHLKSVIGACLTLFGEKHSTRH